MGPEPTFDRSKVIPETLRILASSDDPLVHMETLRRAYIYSMEAQESIDALGAKLRDGVVVASVPVAPSDAPDARRETLAWFDFGYYAAIVRNNARGKCDFAIVPCHRLLGRAAAGAPKDAALQFGAGIGQAFNSFPGDDDPKGEAEWRRSGWRRLETALKLSSDPASPTAKNLMSFFGSGSGPSEKPLPLDAVRKEIEEQLRSE